jgi:hypothetical protein
MDLIERIFHVAPDGGNGMLELLILLLSVSVPLGVRWLRVRRRRASDAVSARRLMLAAQRE